MKQQTIYQDIVPLLARVLFAGVFVTSAAGLIGSFTTVVGIMAAKGVVAPGALLGLVIAAWVLGGLCLLAGFRIRLIASVLAVLLLAVTLGMHAPWTADAASFPNELNNFLKNLGFIAGLLALAAGPAGLLAMDGKDVRGRAGTGNAQPEFR